MNQVESWYKQLPIITRSYMTACCLTTLAVHLDIISLMDIYLNFQLVYQRMEIWRLFTNFLFFGQFGLGFIFHMVFLVRHSEALEQGSYRGKAADFLFMYIFGGSMLLFIDWAIYSKTTLNPLFLGPSLAFMIVYVWARRNPHARMNFLGLFNFNAPYLPWVILLIEYLADPSGSIFDLLGIIVGHIYYFFVDIYPRTSGRHLLKTPGILKHLIDGPVVEPQVAGRAANVNNNNNDNNNAVNNNNNVPHNNDVAAPVN